ncbi:uncharacterized protein LOC144141242 isoform X2 [Haemaphysalis longicornis]
MEMDMNELNVDTEDVIDKPVRKMQAKIENFIVHSPYPDLEKTENCSLYKFLNSRVQTYGATTAVVYGKERIEFSEFFEKVKRVAAGFQSHGICKGHRVLAHVPNGIDSFIAVCSVPMTGATLVTSDITFSDDEVLEHVKNTDATHILTDKAFIPLFRPAVPHLQEKTFFVVSDFAGCVSVSSFLRNKALNYIEPVGCGKSITFVGHSTGTTGASKIIEVTLENFLSQISCREKFGLAKTGDVCIGGGNVSFYVCFTYSFFVISIGATLVLLEKYSPIPDVFQAFEEHKVNVVHGTPMKLLEIAHETKRNGKKFHHVKSFTSLGTPISEKISAVIMSVFEPEELRSCYGMTEVSGYLSASGRGEISTGDVGFPVSGARLKIVDINTGVALGPNNEGAVLFHVPYTMVGYYKNPAETAEFKDSDGWVHTGDLGYYTTEGRLFVTGRIKAMANKYGLLSADLAKVEECLVFHPGVAEAAVVPMPISEDKAKIAALIVATDTTSPSRELAESIKSFVKERFDPVHQLEGGIYFVDVIPRSGFGKIKRRQLPQLVNSLDRMDLTTNANRVL